MLNKNKSIIKKFCQKANRQSDFYEFVMKNLNKNADKENLNNDQKKKKKFFQEEQKDENKENSRFFKERNYFKLKENILSPKIIQDMQILKLKEGFSENELRQKYLSLAKLYHPDVLTNDKHAKEMFLQYKESYERLKIYLKYKENLNELEKRVSSGDGITTFNYGGIDYSEIFNYQDSKQQYIKTLLLEDEYGDIKEPKYIIQFLFGVWVITGGIIFFIDLKKYLRKLSRKKEWVNYDMKLIDFLRQI